MSVLYICIEAFQKIVPLRFEICDRRLWIAVFFCLAFCLILRSRITGCSFRVTSFSFRIRGFSFRIWVFSFRIRVLVSEPGVFSFRIFFVSESGVLVSESGVLVSESGVLVSESGVLVSEPGRHQHQQKTFVNRHFQKGNLMNIIEYIYIYNI